MKRRIHLIETATGREVGRIERGQSAAFAPDNQTLVVAAENGDVQIWDLPLRTPWWWIALAALGAVMATYGLLA